MMTSSNGNILLVTGPLGESSGHRCIPLGRPVTRRFDFSLICAWTNGQANNRDAGDLRRYRTHYNVTVMKKATSSEICHEGNCVVNGGVPQGQFSYLDANFISLFVHRWFFTHDVIQNGCRDLTKLCVISSVIMHHDSIRWTEYTSNILYLLSL